MIPARQFRAVNNESGENNAGSEVLLLTIPASRRLDFSEIPIIDLSAGGSGNDNLVDAVGDACREVGFFYITNHGIKVSLIDDLLQQARTFFALPLESKQSVLLDRRMRGYLPLKYRSYEGEENAATSHQEGFWIGHERALDSEFPLQGPNRWPQDLPELQSAMLAYFVAVEDLSQNLLRCFSRALGLSADYLPAFFNNPNSRLKLNHYPPQREPITEQNLGVVAHSDSGCFTILWQDDESGLEVQNHAGEWVGAPPLAGSFVVNIGNILQYWSNGEFSSTPHRVINRNNRDRYSIPFFVNPDHGSSIRPLCNTDQPGFTPFDYVAYQLDFWRRSFPVAAIPDD